MDDNIVVVQNEIENLVAGSAIFSPPSSKAKITIGGNWTIYVQRKFNWFQRLMMKICFGFEVKKTSRRNNMHMYKITADYRPKNPNKLHYYVPAKDAKSAKRSFRKAYNWLKVYDVEEVPVDEAREIFMHPYYKHTIVNWIGCNGPEEIV